MRTKDLLALATHMAPYKDEVVGFDPVPWLLNDDNYALTKDDCGYALFEVDFPHVYYGHFFMSCKGKEAKEFSKDCLEYMFTETDCLVIKGLTPEHNKAARWMTRQLGFSSYGILDTFNGPHELFILTKNDWETHQ